MSINTNTYRADGGGREQREVISRTYDIGVNKAEWDKNYATESTSGSNATPPPQNNGESKSKVDSKKKADKEYIYKEFNTLSGELSLTPTEKSIRIRVNDTVKINGIGKYLSGLYFVESIRRTLNTDSGYTHTLTVFKNGFGDSLKKKQEETTTRKTEISKTPTDLKVGETVRIVGENATYSNASEGVKVPAWVKKKELTIKQISSDGTRVLLMPINSWTYTSNIQKK